MPLSVLEVVYGFISNLKLSFGIWVKKIFKRRRPK